jgi:hypothetical protein
VLDKIRRFFQSRPRRYLLFYHENMVEEGQIIDEADLTYLVRFKRYIYFSPEHTSYDLVEIIDKNDPNIRRTYTR